MSEDRTEYPKIESLYRRESAKPHRLLVGQYASSVVEVLKDIPWEFIEKVDGTNIGVIWDGHKVSYGGRTAAAQIPVKLLDALEEYFGGDAGEQLLEQQFGDAAAVLYGEGYGAGIQKGGGNYCPSADFVLFDVKIDRWWMRRESLEDIAAKLGLPLVPIVFTGTLREAEWHVRTGLTSAWATESTLFQAEGLVGRPVAELYDRHGHRITVKIKGSDFAPNRVVEPEDQ